MKKSESTSTKGTILYHDIGDYHSQLEKLALVKKLGSTSNSKMTWQTLKPNEYGDWVNQRNDMFSTFIPIGDKENRGNFFVQGLHCRGLETARDAWVYNSNRELLTQNIQRTIEFFNAQTNLFSLTKLNQPGLVPENFVSFNNKQISWSRAFLNDVKIKKNKTFDETMLGIGLYRPFFKQHLYFSRELNNVVSRIDSFFPKPHMANLIICVSGLGGSKETTSLISDTITDLNCLDSGTQCFPLYYYEERPKSNPTLFDEATEREFIRRDGVSDFILDRTHKMYGNRVCKEDVFYFVYGMLHNPEYRIRFANDLKKMLPRIPLVEEPNDFWKFSKAGRLLAELHVYYEQVPPFEGVVLNGAESGFYRVEKMRFPKKDQKDTIIFNSKITIENIPEKAYEYVVNGKSAIEWIMERYQVTTHKESGIRNDPNDWAEEVGNPRYILDLLLSIINLSVKTVEIVEGLPKLKFE